MKTTVIKLLAERPTVVPVDAVDYIGGNQSQDAGREIPANWLIFNAPRPLAGHVGWIGEFRHGLFYVAIDPGDEWGQRYIRRTIELDGWLIEFVDRVTTLKAFAQKTIDEYRLYTVPVDDAIADVQTAMLVLDGTSDDSDAIDMLDMLERNWLWEESREQREIAC